VSLVFGWTFLGWLAALVWAAAGFERKQPAPQSQEDRIARRLDGF
jgi:hypothetical protein